MSAGVRPALRQSPADAQRPSPLGARSPLAAPHLLQGRISRVLYPRAPYASDTPPHARFHVLALAGEELLLKGDFQATPQAGQSIRAEVRHASDRRGPYLRLAGEPTLTDTGPAEALIAFLVREVRGVGEVAARKAVDTLTR